jgi:Zn-dependent protease with chaperone function
MNAVAGELALDDVVYPRERTLGAITLVIGLLVWLALIVGTFGGALLLLGLGWVLGLFVHSALIAHLKGNAVEISQAQFPDLYAQFTECCRRLRIETPPQAYIVNGNGILNAFATKFLRTQYVVLTSDVVDAMHGNAEGLRFYMGHELGHLRMKHISKQLLRWPALWLPLLAPLIRAHGRAPATGTVWPAAARGRPPLEHSVCCLPVGRVGEPSTSRTTFTRPSTRADSGCHSMS